MTCSYCGTAKAIHSDHIVSKAMRNRKAADGSLLYPGWEGVVVPACGPCNWRKLNRRIVPMDYEPFDKLPGTRPWMRWNGDPKKLSEILR